LAGWHYSTQGALKEPQLKPSTWHFEISCTACKNTFKN